MIFYFTGTGNSLYAAKKLDKECISIPQAMKKEALEFTADCIGIATPIYGHEVPPKVKEFLKKAKFHTKYFYMVLTYGNRHAGAAELAKQLCDKCGICVNYIAVVRMVDNWLVSFDMEEEKRKDKKVDEQIAAVYEDICNRKNRIAAVTDDDRAAHREYLSCIGKLPKELFENFIKVSDGCVGCGICQRVCPSASMRLINGKATHIPGNCQTCLACVHACAQKAIRLAVPEKNPNARYRNEHITLEEIILANNQM